MIYRFFTFRRRQFRNEGMFGGERNEANAEQRIGARGEHLEFVAAFGAEFDFTARGFSDPVSLH